MVHRGPRPGSPGCAGPCPSRVRIASIGVSARDTDWDGVRLHVVTGKGGTGKTTVAAALALALASGGRNVLLMEVEGRQGIAQLFDCPPLPYGERKVAVGLADGPAEGGDVYALAVDPEEAFLEYLAMFYNLRHAGQALTRLGVVDFVTTLAPGLSDVLITGKAAEAVRRRRGGKHVYHAVVMDAPPTGRIGRFLNVAAEVSGLARVGPIRGHADTVKSVIASPQTAVHFVTVLEEMPVQETLDGVAELRDQARGGLQVGGIMINMMRPPVLGQADLAAASNGTLDVDELALGLKAAGLEDSRLLARDLAVDLAEHAGAMELQRTERRRLAAAGQPRYNLPLIPDGMDLAGLYRLAETLRQQRAA
jgi:Anion-transporting ATPase